LGFGSGFGFGSWFGSGFGFGFGLEQLVRASAMLLAASAYSAMLEALVAAPRLGVLPFMSSSLSAA